MFVLGSIGADGTPFFHALNSEEQGVITLEDGSTWTVGWWYTGVSKKWKAGDRLKVFFHSENSSSSNVIEIVNLDTEGVVWASLFHFPAKGYTFERSTLMDSGKLLIELSDGLKFLYPGHRIKEWKAGDTVMIFHESQDTYELFNVEVKDLLSKCTSSSQTAPPKEVSIRDVMHLRDRLKASVFGQDEAIDSIESSIFSYCVGLNDPQKPISVFLFLGSTGVGKTELAKVLARELYINGAPIVRFDMSHFSDQWSLTRLIGSAPGYINHREGGQMTNALKKNTRAIVLLDEFEKAHPIIQKVFLPVFDEGYITDAASHRVDCTKMIFILTANISSQRILGLYNRGLTPSQVLEAIEPDVIQALSPELYSRLQPVVFRPLHPDTIDKLIEHQLNEVSSRLMATREIDVRFDESVTEYLRQNGFHPTLGARPLKALIQKKVISALSILLLKNNIQSGDRLTLSYIPETDSLTLAQ
jgi:ATP-dependent Clp protease ATP-binding subunit ClpA